MVYRQQRWFSKEDAVGRRAIIPEEVRQLQEEIKQVIGVTQSQQRVWMELKIGKWQMEPSRISFLVKSVDMTCCCNFIGEALKKTANVHIARKGEL